MNVVLYDGMTYSSFCCSCECQQCYCGTACQSVSQPYDYGAYVRGKDNITVAVIELE